MHSLCPGPRQTSDIPSARGRPSWEAPTPDRDFPGAPKESGVLVSLCECGRSQHKLPRDIKARDPHLREVVFLRQPQGIMVQNPVTSPLPLVPVQVSAMVIQRLGNTDDKRAGKSNGTWRGSHRISVASLG